MLETRTKNIGGHEWRVSQFTGTKTLKVLYKVFASLGPAAGEAIGIAAGAKSAKKKLTEANLDLAKVVQLFLASNKSEDEIENLLFTLFQNSFVDNIPMSRSVFDDVFAGPAFVNIGPALVFVLETNYGDFMGQLKSYIAQLDSANQTEDVPQGD